MLNVRIPSESDLRNRIKMDIAVGFLKLLLDVLCVWEEKFVLQIE